MTSSTAAVDGFSGAPPEAPRTDRTHGLPSTGWKTISGTSIPLTAGAAATPVEA